jgi:hypothetical protein
LNTNQKTTIEELRLAARNYRGAITYVEEEIITLNPVELVTPINLKEEKARWIKLAKSGIFANPQFVYDKELLKRAVERRSRLQTLEYELLQIKPKPENISNTFVWNTIFHALQDGIGTTYLAEAILEGNDSDAADMVAKKYGFPEEKNIELALMIILDNQKRGSLELSLDNTSPLSIDDRNLFAEHKLNAKQIKEMFIWAMSQYGVESWPIKILDNCSSIDVRDKSSFGFPIIAVPSSRMVDGLKLAELIGHEIECHWRSSVNAKTIGAPKCDDELVYEGLAALKDKAFNLEYNGTFNLNSAYYMIAMNEAMHDHEFGETAKLIYDYLPESVQNREAKAWMYTYRVFRGITDATNSKGYAFTKDRAYFEGFLFAKELQAKGQEAYLNFSTLGEYNFDNFMKIIDLKDVKANSVPDRESQQKSIEKMIKCLNYGSVQVHTDLKSVV